MLRSAGGSLGGGLAMIKAVQARSRGRGGVIKGSSTWQAMTHSSFVENSTSKEDRSVRAGDRRVKMAIKRHTKWTLAKKIFLPYSLVFPSPVDLNELLPASRPVIEINSSRSRLMQRAPRE